MRVEQHADDIGAAGFEALGGPIRRIADLIGDLTHFRENYASNGVPGFNYDRAQTIASLERVKEIEKNLKATVIIQHDPRDIEKLPAFPAAAR